MEGILEFTFVSRRGDQKPVSMVTARALERRGVLRGAISPSSKSLDRARPGWS